MIRTATTFLLLILICALGPDLTAQEDSSMDFVEIKEEMLEMNERMYEIIIGIESVEDARDADQEIGAIFDNLVRALRAAVEGEFISMEQLNAAMENDPEIEAWEEKIEAARATLREEHPEAAAELAGILQKYSLRLMALNNGDVAASDEESDLRGEMLEMSEQVYDIIAGIEFLEDLPMADANVGRVFENFVETLRESMKEGRATLEELGMLMETDAEIQAWDQKIHAAMEALRSDHPEIAAELDTIMQKHREKFMVLMNEMMQEGDSVESVEMPENQ